MSHSDLPKGHRYYIDVPSCNHCYLCLIDQNGEYSIEEIADLERTD
jgi:hypothetical protein